MVEPGPIRVEVLTHAPTIFFQCQQCEFIWQQTGVAQRLHREQIESSIPKDLMEPYRQLSDWVIQTAQAFDGRVVFKIIDAVSMEGVFKSLRYGVRRYPAIIIDGKDKITGFDMDQVSPLIDRQVAARFGH